MLNLTNVLGLLDVVLYNLPQFNIFVHAETDSYTIEMIGKDAKTGKDLYIRFQTNQYLTAESSAIEYIRVSLKVGNKYAFKRFPLNTNDINTFWPILSDLVLNQYPAADNLGREMATEWFEGLYRDTGK